MLYLKQKNNTIIEYPYDINLLYEENSDVSFPNPLNADVLALFDVYEVQQTKKPVISPITQVCEEIDPILVDGKWQQNWFVRNKTSEEQEAYKKQEEEKVRQKRDTLLSESDWVVAKSYEFGEPVPQIWQDYRQFLRDVPQHSGFPYNIQWPEKPKSY
jgi:hypothetical protein